MKKLAALFPLLVILAWIALSVATYLKVCGLETALCAHSSPVAASKENGPENAPDPVPGGSVNFSGLFLGGFHAGPQGNNPTSPEQAK